MFCQSTIRNSDACLAWCRNTSPILSPSLSLFLFLRHLCTPWHRTPNVGDADVKKAPLLNSDSQCTIIPPPQLQHSPPLPRTPPSHLTPPLTPLTLTLQWAFSYLSYSPSLLFFALRKVRGTFETKDEKWKLRVWKHQHTSHSFFEEAGTVPLARLQEWSGDTYCTVFKFQERVRFQ